MHSSSEVAAKLAGEGFRVIVKRIANLLQAGHLSPPPKVSGIYVWTDPEVDRLRRLLCHLDGDLPHRSVDATEGGAR